jgi:hypothetical protein
MTALSECVRPSPARESGRYKSERGESYCEGIVNAIRDDSIRSRLLFTWEGNRTVAYRYLTDKTGFSHKTLQDWARALERLGVAILQDLTRTPLDTAREIDALGKLPADERTDLLNALKRGETVSAVKRLNAFLSANRLNQTDELFVLAGQVAGKPSPEIRRFISHLSNAIAEVRKAERTTLSKFEMAVQLIGERDFARKVAAESQAQLKTLSMHLSGDEMDMLQHDIEREYEPDADDLTISEDLS